MIVLTITLRECSKEEFESFLRNYPAKLERHDVYICSPAVKTYNDLRINKDDLESPYSSMVAYCQGFDDNDMVYYIWNKPLEEVNYILSGKGEK